MSLPVPVGTSVSVQAIIVMESLTAWTTRMKKAVVSSHFRLFFKKYIFNTFNYQFIYQQFIIRCVYY